MTQYTPMQNYNPYAGMMPQPYPDRLTQLQNQYQQAVNVQQMPQTPTPVNQGLLWVQGEGGAKSYLVAPNSTVLLMDSDAQRFYLKSADNAGMPNLRIFEYNEITNAPQNAPQSSYGNEKDLDSKYVTREEYEGLKRQYADIMDKMQSLSNQDGARTTKAKIRGGAADEQPDL